jgi:HTH-type transcriptional regulator / antitoxin HigA
LGGLFYPRKSRHQPVASFIEGLKRRGVSEQVIQDALNEAFLINR